MPGKVQLSGQQTARSNTPNLAWVLHGIDRFARLIPFIQLNFELAGDYFNAYFRLEVEVLLHEGVVGYELLGTHHRRVLWYWL